MNQNRTFSRLAIFGLGWALLSTPLSTLTLLNVVEQHGGRISRWVAELGSVWKALIVGVFLIVPPAVGLIIGSVALFEVRSSWQPLDGEGCAKAALIVSGISMLCALGILFSGFAPD